jgi:Rap1a immunity proteins
VSAGIRSAAVGLVIGMIVSEAVWAHDNDQNSGLHWLRKCTSPEPNGQIECAIYVRALVEYDELRGKALQQKRFFCPEKGVTVGQSRQTVLEYLRANPQDLHLPFALLAHQALVAAFPCPGHDALVGATETPPPR